MYVLLGSNGNITSKVAALLLEQGAPVRVVGRNSQSLARIETAGAQIAAGDIGDAGFLSRAFAGAMAVYAMIPTDYSAHDLSAEQDRLGVAIAGAISLAGVKRVVNLSSVAAGLSSGTGPIAGLHRQEQRLNELAGVEVLHLRPGHFFENHLAAIEMIRSTAAYVDTFAPESPLPMVATSDIARVVARELLKPSGTGKRVLHLRAPSLYTLREATAILGAAINKPNLAYIQISPEQGTAALLELGFSASAAAQLVEMNAAFSSGRLNGEYDNGPTEIAATTLPQFAATVFKPAFDKS
jgi:uncharacterized protein YbjT (DUF2867 family)